MTAIPRIHARALTGLFFGLLLAACAPQTEPKKEEKSGKVYQYKNGCTIEARTYTTRDELCDLLRDDEINGHCASAERYERFKQECPGRKW